jgi:hypothetical protein
MDRYDEYSKATDIININLKKIAVICGIKRKLSTYYARYSWTNIGRKVGLSIDDVSLGLGHQDPKYKVTAIYLDEDQDMIDLANRRIIDHIINIPLSV